MACLAFPPAGGAAASQLGPTCVRHQAPLARRLPAHRNRQFVPSDPGVMSSLLSCVLATSLAVASGELLHKLSKFAVSSQLARVRSPNRNLVESALSATRVHRPAWESEERVQLVVAKDHPFPHETNSMPPQFSNSRFGKGRARLNICCSGHQTQGTIDKPWAE